jgi:cytochrome c-type biogenesis protein
LEWMAQFESIARTSPVLAIFLSFAGGVLASCTPCTYPMMPITVAFIGGRAGGKRMRGFVLSVFYVLGLAVVYSALGAFAALSGQMFGTLTASPWAFFAVGNICIFFGLAMLDVVSLPVPAFMNRIHSKQFQGGDLFTSALLGGVSALVVSTCTTPVLGVLLTLVAAKQNLLWGIGMLFAFSFGLGAMVIIVGTFTGLLTSLPRSGIWMRRVQKSFGLLMILVAEYFLIKAGEYWL